MNENQGKTRKQLKESAYLGCFALALTFIWILLMALAEWIEKL